MDGSEIHFKEPINPFNEHKQLLYANGKYKENQIWLYCKSWKDEFKTLEFLSYVINHETIHAIIRKILDGDKLWNRFPKGIWTHFPFACELDELFGISFFLTHVYPKILSNSYYIVEDLNGKQYFYDVTFAKQVLNLRSS